MKRVFPTLAVLMAMMLAIWIIGCGGDEECEDPDSTVTETTPATGGEIAANGQLIIKFDNPPKAGTVNVNGTAATGSGTTYTWAATGLTAGDTAALNIEWTNACDTAGAGHSVTLNVLVEDKEPPVITGSDPTDGAKDVDVEGLTEITITFDDNMNSSKTKPMILIGDEEITWVPKWNDDKTEVTLEAVAGKDIPMESEVTVDISGATDDAGNTADLSITFTTKAKEE
jgi:hypothetical protein